MRKIVAIVAALTVFSPLEQAHAGIFGDDLTRCIVKSSSDSDQVALITWIYSAMSAHPSIRSYSTITDAQRETSTKDAGSLFMRLLTVDCKNEAALALQNEGDSAVEQAFAALGRVAMASLMHDPGVQGKIANLNKYIDENKLKSLAEDKHSSK
jgi:hypothetical protein